MLKGGNSNEVTHAIDARVAQIQSSLPAGVRIAPYLNRSDLVGRTLRTVEKNLLEGALVVGLLLLLMLGNWRAALVVTSVIPLALLFALGCMKAFDVSANLMSLGAIDFGIVVDGAVIVVEATLMAFHRKGLITAKDREETVIESASSIYGSAAFGVLIILVVFLPILTLSGIEGKMFKPMAQTVVFALVGALILSTTYVPALVALVLRPETHENKSERFFHGLRERYALLLEKTMARGSWVLGGVLGVLALAVLGFTQLGSVFLPNLEEGDLALQVSIPTGSNLNEMVRVTTEAEKKLIRHFPEVVQVVSKIGTAEVPTDPMPIEAADVMVLLKPKNEWTSASTREELVEKMAVVLEGVWGARFEFTQPIQLRFNELISGSKSDIALQIYGDHLDTLAHLAQKMATAVEDIPGAEDVKVEATQGMRFHRWVPNRQALAYHGVAVSEVAQVLEMAYAGGIAGQVFEDQRRYDVAVRLAPEDRLDGAGGGLYVRNHAGNRVPLTAVADRTETIGPSQISRSKTSRRIAVGVNVRGRDVASVVEDIQKSVNSRVPLPAGYTLHIGGDFENLQHALARLQVAVPVALALIFILLYAAFRSAAYALLVFTAIPLSAIGGIAALALRGMPFSISAGIGFIALFGVAVLNGIVLVSRVRQLESSGMPWLKAIVTGSSDRLRPVLLTATVAALGFVPMAVSSSAGAEVQKPLATVVIGGLVSATFLTLGVLPVLLVRFQKRLPSALPSASTLALVGIGLFAAFPAKGQNETLFPSLQEVQRRALEVHGEVRMARARYDQAELKPDVLLESARGTVQYGQMNGVPRDYYFSLEQPLGSLASHVQRGKRNAAEVALRSSEREHVERSVALSVALAYADYWRLGKEVAWRKLVFEQGAQEQARIQARESSGEWSPAEGASYRLLLRRWESEYRSAQAEWAQAAGTLSALTHLPWASGDPGQVALPARIDFSPPSDTALAPLFHQLAQSSVDLAQSEWRLAQTAWFPEWSVGAFQQELEAVKGFNGIYAGISLPLAAHVPAKRAKSAQVEVQAQQSQAEQALYQWRAEKNAAYAAWKTWQHLPENSGSQADAAVVLKALRAQWEEGESTFSDTFLPATAASEGALLEIRHQSERLKAAVLLHFYTQKP
jgi:cobalt-zinc-cadmium resistance protein CzcA